MADRNYKGDTTLYGIVIAALAAFIGEFFLVVIRYALVFSNMYASHVAFEATTTDKTALFYPGEVSGGLGGAAHVFTLFLCAARDNALCVETGINLEPRL